MTEVVPYTDRINFNVLNYPPISQVTEAFPQEGQPERKVAICRCWQSKKFPYCDGAHKAMMQNGDNVGPYVAVLRTRAHMQDLKKNAQQQQQQQQQQQKTRAAFRVASRIAKGSAVIAGVATGALGGYLAADLLQRTFRKKAQQLSSSTSQLLPDFKPAAA
ncbi:hypothetical protein, conserved [Eimeria necatrix]|uniref:Iron-binding zinc finger CDGSH type domain-containing protein n=1 Tax=Eimeria necatrix TaxID=51315 RepID=U6N895_9EIME|nr:hypothetical protein, conserved [Eimeria necatrix]CDJ70081.1 hypothetical protein, conserved [Eimeria necatrix]